MARQCLVSRTMSNVQEAERRIFYNYIKKYSNYNRAYPIVSARASGAETLKIRYDDYLNVNYEDAKNYGLYPIRKGTPSYRLPCLKYDFVKKAVNDSLWWIWMPLDRGLLNDVINVTQREYDPVWDNFPEPIEEV